MNEKSIYAWLGAEKSVYSSRIDAFLNLACDQHVQIYVKQVFVQDT